MKKILITNKPDLRSLFVNGLLLVFKPDHYIDLKQDAFYIYDVFHKDNGDFTFSKANVRPFDVGAHFFVIDGVKILILHKEQNRRFPLAQVIRLGKKHNCEIVFARTKERVFRYQDGILIVGFDSFESSQILGLSFSVLIHVEAGHFLHASLIRHKEVSIYTGQVQNELIQKVYAPRTRLRSELKLSKFDDFYIEKQNRVQLPANSTMPADTGAELAEVHSLQRYIRPDRSVMKTISSVFSSNQTSYPISLQKTNHLVSRNPDAPVKAKASNYYLYPDGSKGVYSIDDLLLEKHWEDEYQKQLLDAETERPDTDHVLELEVPPTELTEKVVLDDESMIPAAESSSEDVNDLDGFDEETLTETDDQDNDFTFPTTSLDDQVGLTLDQEIPLPESDTISYDLEDEETYLDDQTPVLPVEDDLEQETDLVDPETDLSEPLSEETYLDDQTPVVPVDDDLEQETDLVDPETELSEPLSEEPLFASENEDQVTEDDQLAVSADSSYDELSSDVDSNSEIDPNDEGWVPYEQTPEGSQDGDFSDLVADWNEDLDHQLAEPTENDESLTYDSSSELNLESDLENFEGTPEYHEDQLAEQVDEQPVDEQVDDDIEADLDEAEQFAAEDLIDPPHEKRPGFFKRLFGRLFGKKKPLINDVTETSIDPDDQLTESSDFFDQETDFDDQSFTAPNFEYEDTQSVDSENLVNSDDQSTDSELDPNDEGWVPYEQTSEYDINDWEYQESSELAPDITTPISTPETKVHDYLEEPETTSLKEEENEEEQEKEEDVNYVADGDLNEEDWLVNELVNETSESEDLDDLIAETVETEATPSVTDEQIPTHFDGQKVDFSDDPLLNKLNQDFETQDDHLPSDSQLVDRESAIDQHVSATSDNSQEAITESKITTTNLENHVPLENNWCSLDEIGVPYKDQKFEDLSELTNINTDRLPWFDDAKEDTNFEYYSKVEDAPGVKNPLEDSQHPSLKEEEELEYQPLIPIKPEDDELHEFITETELTDAGQSELDHFEQKIPRDPKVQTFEEDLGIYDFHNFNQEQFCHLEPSDKTRLTDYQPTIIPVINDDEQNPDKPSEIHDQHEFEQHYRPLYEHDDEDHAPLEEIDATKFDVLPNLEDELAEGVFVDPLELDQPTTEDHEQKTVLTKELWAERHNLIQQLKVNFEDALLVIGEFNQIADRCIGYVHDDTIWAQKQRDQVHIWETKANQYLFAKTIEEQFVAGRFLINNHKLNLINKQLIYFVFKFMKRAIGLLNLLIRRENTLLKPRKAMKLHYKAMKRLEKLFKIYQKKYRFE